MSQVTLDARGKTAFVLACNHAFEYKSIDRIVTARVCRHAYRLLGPLYPYPLAYDVAVYVGQTGSVSLFEWMMQQYRDCFALSVNVIVREAATHAADDASSEHVRLVNHIFSRYTPEVGSEDILVIACKTGNATLLQWALSHGFAWHWTYYCNIVAAGHLKLLKHAAHVLNLTWDDLGAETPDWLYNTGPMACNQRVKRNVYVVIMVAIREDHLPCVQWLWKHYVGEGRKKQDPSPYNVFQPFYLVAALNGSAAVFSWLWSKTSFMNPPLAREFLRAFWGDVLYRGNRGNIDYDEQLRQIATDTFYTLKQRIPPQRRRSVAPIVRVILESIPITGDLHAELESQHLYRIIAFQLDFELLECISTRYRKEQIAAGVAALPDAVAPTAPWPKEESYGQMLEMFKLTTTHLFPPDSTGKRPNDFRHRWVWNGLVSEMDAGFLAWLLQTEFIRSVWHWQFYVDLAALGHFELIRQVHKRYGFPLTPEEEIHGHDTMETLFRGYEICDAAVKFGNVTFLVWARQQGCKWNERTCDVATLPMLQWLRANNCPWDETTAKRYARDTNKGFEKFVWSVRNGCPYNQQDLLQDTNVSDRVKRWLATNRICE